MEPKATISPKVYLIGDNDDSNDQFKLTLCDVWPTEAKCLNRTEFDKLSDSDLEKGKFIFVIPSSPHCIIYDEGDPARSFHKQINKADTPQGRRGAFIVVYTDQDGEQLEAQSFSDEVGRLYRAGSQTALARFAEQSRIISLPDGKKLNDKQIDDIKRFLRNLPEEIPLDQVRQDEFEALRQLSKNFASLVNSEKFSDVALTVQGDGKQVYTLQAFLVARSQVFEKRLESKMGDSGGPVELEIGASFKVTLAAVQWITTARLDLDEYDITEICELLVLADEYKLMSLKKLCEKRITEQISAETVLKVLIQIDKAVSDRVHSVCIQFATENASHIKSQPEYCTLSADHFRDLFECATTKDK